jgi:hypothetical protein
MSGDTLLPIRLHHMHRDTAKSTGAFAKLRKATIDFMSVCLSVRTEQLGSHWTDIHEILYLSIFRKIRPENSSSITICQQ